MSNLTPEQIQLANQVSEAIFKTSRCADPNVLEDMRSAAYIGLISAAENFDPSKNIKFSTYANFRIAGSIKDYWRTEGKHKGYKRNPKGKAIKACDVINLDEALLEVEPSYLERTINRMAAREQLASILREMRKLDKRFAFIFYLWALKHNKYIDIAKRLNCSASSISIYMKRYLNSYGISDAKKFVKTINALTF